MPPKMNCPYDFEEVKELREVEPVGVVETYTVVDRDFYGEQLKKKKVLAFIKFPGVEGGLIHYVMTNKPRIGMRVRHRWMAERRGLVTDIEYCEEA